MSKQKKNKDDIFGNIRSALSYNKEIRCTILLFN